MYIYLDFRVVNGSGVPFLVCFLPMSRQIARKIGRRHSPCPSIADLKSFKLFLVEYQYKSIKTSVKEVAESKQFSRTKIYYVPIMNLITALDHHLN